MSVSAVLFDFGGVILSSPFDAFTAYEASAGLPHGFLRKLNSTHPDTNAWACMERGEIDEATFHRRLEAEAKALGGAVDARLLLSRISGTLYPEMVALVRRLRDRYRVACLTNNMRIGLGPAMSSTPERAAEIAEVIKLFEHVVESCRIGARKPEARFFEIACATVGVKPDECVYLDDLGINLKPARALGMQTIKVVSPTQAIADLAAILGHA